MLIFPDSLLCMWNLYKWGRGTRNKFYHMWSWPQFSFLKPEPRLLLPLQVTGCSTPGFHQYCSSPITRVNHGRIIHIFYHSQLSTANISKTQYWTCPPIVLGPCRHLLVICYHKHPDFEGHNISLGINITLGIFLLQCFSCGWPPCTPLKSKLHVMVDLVGGSVQSWIVLVLRTKFLPTYYHCLGIYGWCNDNIQHLSHHWQQVFLRSEKFSTSTWWWQHS